MVRAVLIAAVLALVTTSCWPRHAAALPIGAPASAPITFTVAGMESVGGPPYRAPCAPGPVCRGPRRWPASWPATEARLTGDCVAQLPDGRLLLCEAGRLLALGVDGRLRQWPTAHTRLRIGYIADVVVDSDGSAVALGDAGVARVRPDGSSSVLARLGVYGAGLDLDRGGGVLVGGASANPDDLASANVLRVASDGTVRRVAGSDRYRRDNGDGGPATKAILDAVDVAALSDGSFLIADSSAGRIRAVDPAGVIRTVAGGGRRWREGAAANTVRLPEVFSVQALPGGQILVGSADGVFRIDPDGRIFTVLRGGDERDVRRGLHLATDGSPAAASVFPGVVRTDVLHDGSLVIAQEIHTMGTRIAWITTRERMNQFAVALPRADRVRLRHGRLDVVSTHAASAVVRVIDRPRTIATSRVRLAAGRTRIRLRIRPTARPLIVKVVATTSDGRVATHRVTALATRTLSRRAVGLLRAAIAFEKDQEYPEASFFLDRCRRVMPDRYRCRWSQVTDDGSSKGRATLVLRRDGLVSYTERGRRGRVLDRRTLEPQT